MSQKPPPQHQQNDGRNEYIPSYISKAPFYAEGLSDGDYLEHQRLHATPKDTLDKAKWYDRGKRAGPAATKYRKGACENCGAMSHKTKDCLERPRKHGAKWTGRDIQADEIVDKVSLGWDAKRDRWNGYDAREYTAVVKEFEEMEQLRQGAAHSALQNKSTENGTDTNDENDTEAKYAEETDMGRSQPTSTRQLRLREDTAKYLLNLDLDSAQYDPKTRSMDTTSQTLSNNPTDTLAEEGFVRPSTTSDDAAAFERAQKYAWETQDANKTSSNLSDTKKLHLQANPTEGELLLKKHTQDTTAKKEAQRKALIDKYGDQAHLQTSNPNTTSTITNKSSTKAILSSESYTEYDKHGNPKLPQGQSRPKPQSKYPEDIMTNNHTSVFGSFWSNFTWGYSCCHSTVKNSYCTGESGKIAFRESQELRTGTNLLLLPPTSGTDQIGMAKAQDGHEHRETESVEKDEKNSVGDDDTGAVGLGSEEKRRSKRPFADVTEEEMEAYKRSKVAADDPMKAWGSMGDDGLLKS